MLRIIVFIKAKARGPAISYFNVRKIIVENIKIQIMKESKFWGVLGG